MGQPYVYSTPSPYKTILIIILLLAIIPLSFAAGYFISNLNLANHTFSHSSNKSESPLSTTASNLTVGLPIEKTSSAVKSLWIVYLLTGVVDNITPISKNNTSGYEIQVLSPAGPLINQRFFASDQATNVVLLDKKGKETKYKLSALKKGDSIQLNYQVDIKNIKSTQVTRIAVLK